MAKVYLICGKICCGKSTYAKKLQSDRKAIILSIDEIMLAIFGLYAGEKHDEYTDKVRKYLFEKSLEVIKNDVDVILDWGFWTKSERNEAKEFYKKRNIEWEIHYIDISKDTWQSRIDKRNEEVKNNKTTAYIIDNNLMQKFESKFEMPTNEEIDIWVY